MIWFYHGVAILIALWLVLNIWLVAGLLIVAGRDGESRSVSGRRRATGEECRRCGRRNQDIVE